MILVASVFVFVHISVPLLGYNDNSVDDFCSQDLFRFVSDEHFPHSLSARRDVKVV